MLGKIVNGMLVRPTKDEKKKLVVTNPTDDVLRFCMGYKSLTICEKPEYDDTNQVLVPIYEETDTEIIQSWSIQDMEMVDVL